MTSIASPSTVDEGAVRELSSQVSNPSGQRISGNGRIRIPKVAWIIRVVVLGIISAIIWTILTYSLQTFDAIMIISLILPIHTLTITIISWVWYRNPGHGHILRDDPLVSVLIPVYNQESMIAQVIDAIFASTYKNLEVIAVNDGSRDGTIKVLQELAKKYERLKVIDRENQGKRKAVGTGFASSTGEYIILIDSDSIIDPLAIKEFIKTFQSNPSIGATVGHVKVWNADTNVLTRCQDTWYDFAFNIQKACESVFGSVTCCSGCLAGYRRKDIEKFMPYWMSSQVDCSDDRELTSFVIAPKFGKNGIIEMMPRKKSIAERLLESAASYDDAEDRVLTANALNKLDAVYVASAIVYTDVPEKLSKFTRQQERWKKGYLRTNFYVSTFFWKRHPLMAFIYYTEYAASFITPFIALGVTLIQPLLFNEYWMPVGFISLMLLKGFLLGTDYKFRDPTNKSWKYSALMNMISQFLVSFMLIPALFHIRNNKWGTR